jgi:hypothetical protein
MDERVLVAVAVCFALSGCVGAVDPVAIGQGWEDPSDERWQKPVLAVSYEAPDDDRAYGPLLDRALDYWNEHAERHAGYEVEFRHVDDGDAADVRVRFVESVDECGAYGDGDAAGCAPVLDGDSRADRPVEVEVQTGLSDESTVRVLKHELGHTLGLSHDDGPWFMSDRIGITTLPRRNATERVMPWRSDDLVVHLDLEGAPEGARDAVERQVLAAVDYYAADAGGTVPSNVTFSRGDSPDEADVVVTYADAAADDCRSDAGSCGTVTGEDLDGDGALEYHDHLEVVLLDLDVDAVAWHVGRWLGVGFGHADAEDYPEPLRPDAGYDDRRSTWWA